jgi:hypothetical protein
MKELDAAMASSDTAIPMGKGDVALRHEDLAVHDRAALLLGGLQGGGQLVAHEADRLLQHRGEHLAVHASVALEALAEAVHAVLFKEDELEIALVNTELGHDLLHGKVRPSEVGAGRGLRRAARAGRAAGSCCCLSVVVVVVKDQPLAGPRACGAA